MFTATKISEIKAFLRNIYLKYAFLYSNRLDKSQLLPTIPNTFIPACFNATRIAEHSLNSLCSHSYIVF